MNLKYFIDRPVLSIVISVAIVLMGIIGITVLPVEQYPDIAPPRRYMFIQIIPVPTPKLCKSPLLFHLKSR